MKFNLLKKLGIVGLLPFQAIATTSPSEEPSKLPNFDYSYKQLTNNSSEVKTLTTELLGDRVNLATGAFSFTHTDFTLTVNGGLSLDLSRTLHDPDSIFQETREFGNWGLNLPHIYSAFIKPMDHSLANVSSPWQDGIGCSASTARKPELELGTEVADHWVTFKMFKESYWHGDQINLIGEPTYKILENKQPDNTYLKTTKASHDITCYYPDSNSKKEGFKVVSPTGVIYYFEHLRALPDNKYMQMANYFYQENPDCNHEITRNCIETPAPGPGTDMPLNVDLSVLKYHAFMLPSRIEDKFGNSINFEYLSNGRIDKINTSDGQKVEFTWTKDNERIKTATLFWDESKSNGYDNQKRTWVYDYEIENFSSTRSKAFLKSVNLPDSRKWLMSYGAIDLFNFPRHEIPGDSALCGTGLFNNYVSITHPSGVTGQFDIVDRCQSQVSVPKLELRSDRGHTNNSFWSLYWLPKETGVFSLKKKTLTIPNQADTYIWSYDYSNKPGSFDTHLPSEAEKVTQVTNPDQSATKYYHSRVYGKTLNSLLRKEVYSSAGKMLEETRYDYDYLGEEKGSDNANVLILSNGINGSWENQKKDFNAQYNVRTKNITVTSYGSLSTTKYSSNIQSYNQYDVPEYYVLTNHTDGLVKHVRHTFQHDELTNTLNQPEKIYVGETEQSVSLTGTPTSWIKYTSFPFTKPDGSGHNVTLPSTVEVHGQLKNTFNSYHDHGGLKKVTFNAGENGRTIEYSDYKLNIPQKTEIPHRYNSNIKMNVTKLIDNNGWVREVKDLNGVTTKYDYDASGRMTSIDLSNDLNFDHTWLDTKFTWNDAALTRTMTQCELDTSNNCKANTANFQSIEQFDGLYRLIKRTQTDLSNVSNSINNTIYQAFRYNFNNKPTFTSHIQFSDILDEQISANLVHGTTTYYDALGRVESVKFSGLGTKTYDYLHGHKVAVTDLNKNTTTTTYQAFSTPSFDVVSTIESPESVRTEIKRNIFGNALTITQKSTAGGASPSNGVASVTETRMYDDYQNLCLVKRTDVGNTIMGHNALGQIMWQKAGVADNTCVTAEPQGATRFKYDNLGDSHTVTYPDTTPSVTYTHDNVGNLLSLVAGSVRHDYQYNNQSVLELERLSIDNQIQSEIDYGYNNALAPSYIAYPDGTTVHYSPNGFGQPTRAVTLTAQNQVELTIAKNARYHANGTLHSFEYGNGIKHTLEIDKVTQLPKLLKDTGAHGDLLNLTYGFDNNANVTSIIDGVDPSYSLTSLVYDDLDRLKNVTGGAAIGNSAINYDAIGNIVTYKALSRDLTYYYNDHTNLLEKVTGEGTDGKYSVFSYDSRGNVTSNGGFNMDYNLANQMITAKGNTYLYDGYNRRVKQNDGNGTSYSLYSQSGKLLYREKETFSGDGTNFIYLGDKLVAKYGDVTPSQDTRQAYRPFGESINTPTDSIGYTGHKFDTDLNLSYMQARYYDPVIGRFYSNDPVDSLSFLEKGNVHGVNRFTYVNNNPYKYTDPTGLYGMIMHYFGRNDSRAILSGEADGMEMTKERLEIADNLSNLWLPNLGRNIVKNAIRDSLKKGKKSPCPESCFVAGTQVLTQDGYVGIENIQVGDVVWATNVETGLSEWKPVTHTWIVFDRDIYEIGFTSLAGDYRTIEATDSHPFYVLGKGWVETIDLKLGDKFVDNYGNPIVVDSLKNLNRLDTAYNFTVADFHTYYVTTENILVHNCNDTQSAPSGAKNPSTAELLKRQLSAEQIAEGHAFEKHVLHQGQFPFIKTKKQFAKHIESVMANPTHSKKLGAGRHAYYDDKTSTFVVTNPRDPDGGTAFQASLKYFNDQN